MAFAFKRKESVRKAVRRLCRQRLEKALKSLHQGDKLEAIHSVRKEIKKTRAILRLVRAQISRSVYRRWTDCLREAAGHLAEPRDTHVRAQSLESLVAHFRNQLPERPFPKIRELLREECRRQVHLFQQHSSAKTVTRIFNKLLRDSKKLTVRGKGWGAIGGGVKPSFARGKRAHTVVLENPTPESFHEWRKRVKDLWYHLQLLTPLWPEQICAAASELKELSEYLGDDHDLVLLEQAMAGNDKQEPSEKEAEAVRALIRLRQAELRAAALKLGGRFYAEKPTSFCKRLRDYWKIWRREKKKPTAAEAIQV